MRATALLAVIAGLALGAAPAAAKTVDVIEYTGTSFDGSGATAGPFTEEVNQVAVDQSNQVVYVMDGGAGEGFISKFDPAGNALAFSALAGASSISFPNGPAYNRPSLSVDNTITANAGRLVASGGFYSPVRAFDPAGTEFGGTFPISMPGYNCGSAIDPQGDIWVTEAYNSPNLIEFNASGAPTGVSLDVAAFVPNPCTLAIDGAGNFYVAQYNGGVSKFDSSGQYVNELDAAETTAIAVNPNNDRVYVNHGDRVVSYEPDGSLLVAFGQAEAGYNGLVDSNGLAVNSQTGEVYVSNAGSDPGVDIFAPNGTATVPSVITEPGEVNPGGAVLHGTVNADGVDTTECYFEWGIDTSYGNTLPCAEGEVFSGTEAHAVSAPLGGLEQNVSYHFRLFAQNANGIISTGVDRTFKPQGPPTLTRAAVSEVNTDGARLSVDIDPSGMPTEYRFEWGLSECSLSECTKVPSPDKALDSVVGVSHLSEVLTGLTPATTYHFRVVAHNVNGTTESEDGTFTTYPTLSQEPDRCANAHVRQQTRAASTPDCRAYELVSAADAGGYDVLSDLAAGQDPFVASPQAPDRLLYALHFGAIPGIAGDPTNLGPDPYVATRGPGGWTTRYVGIPAHGSPATSPFGSPLAATSEDLGAFAFGGPDICDPCFPGGTGIPVRTAAGDLVQGMAGSLSASPEPAGYVGRPLSADGSRFFFGSTSQFEPDGNSNGDVTIYARDLSSGETEVVSRLPDGSTMTGPGTAQLAASADGTRALVAKLVSTDAQGNRYWRPYLHVEGVDETIDVAPGATTGVLFNGMTEDGSRVAFTTRDQLAGDGDGSADVYVATISGTDVSLNRVSGDGDDLCDPVASPDNQHWNAIDSTQDCSAVAFAGGAGIGREDGSVYFLSPELLVGPGEGELDRPNLYVSRPGEGISYVATLEPGNGALRNAVRNNEAHSYGDIQVSADGRFAAFESTLSLTGFPNFGNPEVYRHDNEDGPLVCASCATTGAAATTGARLSRHGLNLTDDGRIFFTTAEALVLRDTNNAKDAYEWKDGGIHLISTGASPADSGLVTVSSDGVNAFFFTRQTLVPADENGTAMKVYVAREGGGYPTLPPPVPCQASDECHGPGTASPPPPAIRTVEGSGGQHRGPAAKRKSKRCGKGRTVRKGRCVSKDRRDRKRGKR